MKKISVVLKTFEKYNFILSSSKIVNILLNILDKTLIYHIRIYINLI